MQNSNLSAYLKSFIKEYKFYFGALIFIATLASIARVIVDYQVKAIIDAILANPRGNTIGLIILFIFYQFTRHAAFFIHRLLDLRYEPMIRTKTISDMYDKTILHSMHWFDSHMSGEISSKITDFQNNLLLLLPALFYAVGDITIFIVSIIFLLKVSVASTFVVCGFAIIYGPLMTFLLKKQTKFQAKYVNAKQEATGMINDSITNIFSVKVIGNVTKERKLKLDPAFNKVASADKNIRKFNTYVVDSIDKVLIVMMSTVQIFLLVHLFKTGQITAGGFAFAMVITLQIYRFIDGFIENLLFTINPAVASMRASFAFIESGYDTFDKPNAIILNNVKGDIKYENVAFSYNSELNILRNFNVHIKAGQRVGIVGPSGSGKTTFIKCLLRYFDVQSGCILIDGQNIKDVTQESLRAHISIIPQDINMFHRTILENLQIAKYDATFDEIVCACKKAKIHDDIMLMSNQYNSIVGERGIKISGGQRQRIAIARAILKNAPILILDEATSALDTPTEKLIQGSLNDIFDEYKATSIVIAHRLSTLLHMDRILVFENGMIVEDGNHAELLSKNGIYTKLWDTQMNGFFHDDRK